MENYLNGFCIALKSFSPHKHLHRPQILPAPFEQQVLLLQRQQHLQCSQIVMRRRNQKRESILIHLQAAGNLIVLPEILLQTLCHLLFLENKVCRADSCQ